MAHEQSTPEHDLIGRRQALCTFAGVATAIAGISLFGAGTAHAVSEVEAGHDVDTVTADEVARSTQEQAELAHERAMVDALIPTGSLGAWRVEQVHTPRFGAVAVVMRTPAGAAFQVDVLRRDASRQGVAETQRFSLFVANDGDGQLATDEMQARGAKVLAHHLALAERRGTPLPQLLSFRERAAQHPAGGYSVLS